MLGSYNKRGLYCFNWFYFIGLVTQKNVFLLIETFIQIITFVSEANQLTMK